MLEGLDKIDWSKLEQAYGTSENIPDMLRAFLELEEGEELEEVFDELAQCILHQGTLYDVTPVVIPFVLELVEQPTTSYRERLIYILTAMAENTRLNSLWFEFAPVQLKFCLEVYQALTLYIDRYLELLTDSDDQVVEFTAQLLVFLNDVETAPRHSIPELIRLLSLPDASHKGIYLEALVDFLKNMVSAQFREYDALDAGLNPGLMATDIVIYEAILSGLGTFFQLLRHPDRDIRLVAVRLVALLDDFKTCSIVAKQLMELSEQENDLEVRARMIGTMGIIGGEQIDGLIALLDRLMTTAESSSIRTAAALASAAVGRRIPGRCSPQAKAVLGEALSQLATDKQLQQLYDDAMLIRGIMKMSIAPFDPLDVFQAVSLTPEQAHLFGRELIDGIFQRRSVARRTNHETGWTYPVDSHASNQMMYRFGVGMTSHYIPGRKLNQHQRTVLQAIIEKDAFWQIPTNLFSFFYGLPDSREELRKLVEE